tara:strand:+ start:35 stop:208 length:174 start_codon:yes stop_codon:yes gene_type:complete
LEDELDERGPLINDQRDVVGENACVLPQAVVIDGRPVQDVDGGSGVRSPVAFGVGGV